MNYFIYLFLVSLSTHIACMEKQSMPAIDMVIDKAESLAEKLSTQEKALIEKIQLTFSQAKAEQLTQATDYLQAADTNDRFSLIIEWSASKKIAQTTERLGKNIHHLRETESLLSLNERHLIEKPENLILLEQRVRLLSDAQKIDTDLFEDLLALIIAHNVRQTQEYTNLKNHLNAKKF